MPTIYLPRFLPALYSSTRYISQTRKTDVIQRGLVTPRGHHAPPYPTGMTDCSRRDDKLLNATTLIYFGCECLLAQCLVQVPEQI